MSGAAGNGAGGGQDWRPKANPWAIALVVTLAAFMEILDTTIVNVALPHIAGALSASNDEATWTLTSYLVANGIVLPISGWLGRLIGRKRYFVICIAAFTATSFLCGIATTLPQLVIFRLLQGFFGGGLQPNQQAIILDTFPPEKRGAAFSITAIATIVAPVLGPTLGGWITDNYSWRWVFFINIPVGLFAVFAVSALVEDPPWAGRGDKSIDFLGIGLIALGLGCLQVVMDRGEDDDWFTSGFITTMAIMSAIAIVFAIAWLTWTRKPVVDLRVMKNRNFAIGCVLTASFASILYASSVVIPQLAQTVLGFTATWAGLILSPGALVLTMLIPVVQRLVLPNVQARLIILAGFVVLGSSLLYSQTLTPDINFATLAKMRIFQAAGLAFLFVPIQGIAFATLPKELNGDGAALNIMFRNVAGSVGISLATAMVTTRSQIHQAFMVGHLTPFDQGYNALLAANQQAIAQAGNPGPTATGLIFQTLHTQSQVLAYSDVFMFCAGLAFCAAPLALLFSTAKGGGGAPAH